LCSERPTRAAEAQRKQEREAKAEWAQSAPHGGVTVDIRTRPPTTDADSDQAAMPHAIDILAALTAVLGPPNVFIMFKAQTEMQQVVAGAGPFGDDQAGAP
jgi:hypothetical protein